MTDYPVMKVHTFTKQSKKITYPAIITPKYDGVNASFRKGTELDEGGVTDTYHFYSTGRKRWKDNVLAHLLVPLREKFADEDNIVLTGELYKHGLKPAEINGHVAVRRTEPSEVTPTIEYSLFDIAGKYANMPYIERYQVMANTEWPDMVSEIEGTVVESEAQVYEVNALYLNDKYEGSVIRNMNGLYEYKRSYNVQKLKTFEDEEFECIGMYEGKETDKGSRLVGTMGGIVVKGDGIECCVGSGFEDPDREYFWRNRNAIMGKQVTIQHFGRTDGSLRHPVFKAVRDYE